MYDIEQGYLPLDSFLWRLMCYSHNDLVDQEDAIRVVFSALHLECLFGLLSPQFGLGLTIMYNAND